MSIYTAPDGEVRASTLIVGMLYLGTAFLALLAWQGHASLAPWAFGVGAVSMFASICAAPGWIAAFWFAYVRKLPDEQIEEKRNAVNKAMAWLAVVGVVIGAGYMLRPNDASHWTSTEIALAAAVVVAYVFAQYTIDEIKKLRSRSEIMERRIGQLERALNRTGASFSDSFDNDDALDY
jgi:hypothetical protein